ncbi:MAG: hypothetical protein SP1CHLAM54_16230 [Chlamydiia bacterium]|nr:hypothetical protein [Chlamydiia bacterium]MCH9616512.1 hypothetical protein [Chlamydiia bacterium]MCH9629502.1 hypothetical protein [Chlamydiia bacterium]
MSIAYVVNGELKSPDLIKPRILSHDRIIAVDGGYNHCVAMGITPELVIGDLDSCQPENLQTDVYPRDKDKTDLRLALEKYPADKMTLFCATGGRTDHTLVHMLLLKEYIGRLSIDGAEQMFVIDRPTKIEAKPGQSVSLIPLFQPVRLTTTGLKWNVENQTLNQKFTGISNVAVSDHVEILEINGELLYYCAL